MPLKMSGAEWKWRKSKTSVTFVVEVDKAKLDAIKTAIKAAGGKIIS